MADLLYAVENHYNTNTVYDHLSNNYSPTGDHKQTPITINFLWDRQC